MATNYGKAAEDEWEATLSAYAKRHNLSRDAATLEFTRTPEAAAIYRRTKLTARADAVAKAAAMGNVSSEELAKAAFPELPVADAMVAWLETENGREFYADDVAARRAAENGR